MARPPMRTVYQPQETAFDKAEDAVSEYRGLFDHELVNLDDDDVANVLRTIKGSGEAIENQRSVALEEKHNEAPSTEELAEPLSAEEASAETKADYAIGELFGDEGSAIFTKAADDKEAMVGAVLYLADLIDRTPALREKFDDPSFAYPGTRWDAEEDDEKYPGNREPDYHKIEGERGTYSHYLNVVLGTKAGKQMLGIKDILARYPKDVTAVDRRIWDQLPDENTWEQLADKGTMKAAKQRWNARINDSAARLRTAQKFRLKKAEINAFDHMNVQMIGDSLAVSAKKKSPIEVTFNGKPFGVKNQTSEPKSVGTFNRYNVVKANQMAIAAGKPLSVFYLDETVKKAPPKAKDNIPANPTSKQVPDFFMGLRNFLDQKDADFVKRVANFVATLKGDEMLALSFGEVMFILNDQVKPLVQAEIDAASAKEMARQEAEAKGGDRRSNLQKAFAKGAAA